jgi:hypothetical protein
MITTHRSAPICLVTRAGYVRSLGWGILAAAPQEEDP